ncbi:hypothetical protein C8R46DRAFT_1273694 [Mycena filopes]|nr:hypothetical protein C8R46DRAFT_1273694 [Mycena filopes]
MGVVVELKPDGEAGEAPPSNAGTYFCDETVVVDPRRCALGASNTQWTRSLKERIAAIQQREDRDRDRATSPTPSSNNNNPTTNNGHGGPAVTLPASASAGALKAKIAQFEGKGGVPVPRGSFGLPEPAPAPKQRLGLYGNRMQPASGAASFTTTAALLGRSRPSEAFSTPEPRAVALPRPGPDDDRELLEPPTSPMSPSLVASPPMAIYPGSQPTLLQQHLTGGSSSGGGGDRARSPEPGAGLNKDAAKVLQGRGTAFSTALDIARTAEAHVKAERRKSALWHASGAAPPLVPQHTGGLTPQHTGGLSLTPQYTGGGSALLSLTPQHTGSLSLSPLSPPPPLSPQYTGPYSPSMRAFSASGEPVPRPRERVLSFERAGAGGERRYSGFMASPPVSVVPQLTGAGEGGGGEGGEMTEEPGEMEDTIRRPLPPSPSDGVPPAPSSPSGSASPPPPPQQPLSPQIDPDSLEIPSASQSQPPASPPPAPTPSPAQIPASPPAQPILENAAAAVQTAVPEGDEPEPPTPSSTHSDVDLDAHLRARAAGVGLGLASSTPPEPESPASVGSGSGSSFGGGNSESNRDSYADADPDADADAQFAETGEEELGDDDDEADLQPLPNTLHTHAFRAHLSTITERASFAWDGGSEGEPGSAGWGGGGFGVASAANGGNANVGKVVEEGEEEEVQEEDGDGYAPEVEVGMGTNNAGVGARARALYGNHVHASANAGANEVVGVEELGGAVIYTDTAAGSPYRLSGLTERGYTPSLRSEASEDLAEASQDEERDQDDDGDHDHDHDDREAGEGGDGEGEQDEEEPPTPHDPRTPTAPPAPDPRFLSVSASASADDDNDGESRSRPDSLLELYGGRESDFDGEDGEERGGYNEDGEEEDADAYEAELREEERLDALALTQGRNTIHTSNGNNNNNNTSPVDAPPPAGNLRSQRDSLLSLAAANSARSSLVAPVTPPRNSPTAGSAPSTPQRDSLLSSPQRDSLLSSPSTRDSQILTLRPLSTASLADTGSPSHVALAHRVPVGATIGPLRGVERGRAVFVPGASPLAGERGLSPSPSPTPSPGPGSVGQEEQEREQDQAATHSLSLAVPTPAQARATPRPGARAHNAARPNTAYASSSSAQDDELKAVPRRHAYTTGAPRPHTAYVPPAEDDDDDDALYGGVGEFGTISFGGATQSFSAVVHGRVREGSAGASSSSSVPTRGRSVYGRREGGGNHSRSGSDKQLPPMPLSPGYASGELAQLLAEAADLELRLERGELPGEALRRLSMRPPPRSGGVSLVDAPPVPALPAGVQQQQPQGHAQGSALKPQRSLRNPLGRSRSERRTKAKEEGRPVASASVGNLLAMQGEIQSVEYAGGEDKLGGDKVAAGAKAGYYVTNPTPLSPPPSYSFAHPNTYSNFSGDQFVPVPPSPAPTDEIPPTPPPKSPGFGGGTRYFQSLRRLASTSRNAGTGAGGSGAPGVRGSVATSLATSTSSELSSEDSVGLATPPDDGAASVHTVGGTVTWPSLAPKKSAGSLASLAGKIWHRSRSKSSTSTASSIEAPSPPPPLPVPTLPSPPILRLDATPFVIPPIQTTTGYEQDPDSPTSSTPIANPSHSLSRPPVAPLVKAKSYNAPRPPNLILTNSNGSSGAPSLLLPVPKTAPESRPASWLSVSSGTSSMAPSPLFDKAIFDAFPSVPTMPTPQSATTYSRSPVGSAPSPQSAYPSGPPSGGGRPLPVPGSNGAGASARPIIDPSTFMDPGPSFTSKSAPTVTDRSFVQSVHPGAFAREQPLLARLAETQMRVNPLP